MSIGIRAIVSASRSHMEALGVFDQIGTHEPANAPGNGLAGWSWFDRLRPLRSSGLASTSVCVSLNVRISKSMLSEPQDDIDLIMVDAVDLLMDAYSGDFTLGGLCRCVDLIGQTELGALRCDGGYLDQDDGTYRALLVYVPIIVDDCWIQGG